MSKTCRQFNPQFKLDTVLEGLRGEKPISQICRERGIKDSLYYEWREQFERHAGKIFGETTPPRRLWQCYPGPPERSHRIGYPGCYRPRTLRPCRRNSSTVSGWASRWQASASVG